MATLIVTTLLDNSTADAADLTLREAVDQATSGDTITFDPSLSGGTVALTDGQILIDKEITIDGDITGADEKADITIDGSGQTGDRLFEVETIQTLNLASLTLSNGNSSGNGGAVLVNAGANLTVEHSTFSGNFANNGGAIYNNIGSVTIDTSTFVDNEALFNGGAIFADGGRSMTVDNTTFAGNQTILANTPTTGGGALHLDATDAELSNTTITNNSSDGSGGGILVIESPGGGFLSMINTIVSGNIGPGSDIGGTTAFGTGNIIDEDPTILFASVQQPLGGGIPADNGGPVQTVALRDDPSNPALDVGASTLATDARGEARFDVPGVGGDGSNFADAGAFELQCFAAGTLITTAQGEVPVEVLQIGDLVLTEDDRAVPVRWIGRQSVIARRASERLEPVRIRQGALGGGLPRRDLIVTADHGMVLNGLIINASALVNGYGIDFVPLSELPARMTYYHVELEAHEVILANGAASESFVDVATRAGFDNYADYIDLYGTERIIPALPQPRVSAKRLVPPTLRQAISA